MYVLQQKEMVKEMENKSYCGELLRAKNFLLDLNKCH